jgi:GDPmannose 4,6-dehydratase
MDLISLNYCLQKATKYTDLLEDLAHLIRVESITLKLHYGDLSDGVNLSNLIREVEPVEVYNLGAQSHVQVSFSIPQYTAQVDAVGTVAILEAIRSSGKDIRFYQASTSELFGSTPPPQNEESDMKPRSPYAAAKLMAYWCVKNYREGYGIHATNGILFNHESPRRGETFVTKKIVSAAARISMGSKEILFLGNLDSIRDWGYAKEYVESMWLMLQRPVPSDYVVATGIGVSVREFTEAAFSYVGLDWKNHVKVDSKYFRPTEVDALIGDATKIKKELNWSPKVNWQDLVKIMMDAELSKKQNNY